MTAIARGLFAMRRQLEQRWALLVLAVVWPALASGLLSGAQVWRGELVQLSLVAGLTAALLGVVVREASPRQVGHAGLRELELGALLLTGVFVLVAATGGPESFLYPLVYAAVSFLAVIHRHRAVAGVLLVVTAGLEVAVGWSAGWSTVAYHLTFVLFFAAGNLLVLSSLVRRLRGEHSRRIDEALEHMRQEARDFRIISAQLPPESRTRSRDQEELRMAHAAVENIHEQLFHNLDLLRTSLGLHTCALLWSEDAGGADRSSAEARLTVKEITTASDLVRETPHLPGPGILTSVIVDPKPLRLRALEGRRVPPYYAGPQPITDLCAVPLLDGRTLRGILCADRIDDRPFSDEEQQVLTKSATHIRRVIEHERVFAAVERGKYEQERFYRASEQLNAALTLEEVYEKSFAAVRAIAHYDLAVISAADDHSGKHTVRSVVTSDDDPKGVWRDVAARLQGLRFGESSSLVSIAVKNKHYMPAGGQMVDPATLVFDRHTLLPEARSLLVLPLVRGEQVLGAITLATSRPQQYPSQTREMLRVIGHQVGVSVQNARMYKSMVERATTDGLTGLTNHRAFQERLTGLHALAERTGQKYSIILTDIDHFKSINDTYGHPIGDKVLKRVAALFAGRARKVDIVARYGGEEFVLVLPDTDALGAELFANRLREEVGAMAMNCENGRFQITISMGVAEYPTDGLDRRALIERADQALYYCKHSGRNRVKRWAAIESG